MSEDNRASAARAMVDAALELGVSSTVVARGADALAELCQQATPEDPAAFHHYHSLLFALHERFEPSTYAVRRWLCQRAYAVEESRLTRIYAGDARFDVADLSPAEFRERIVAEHERRSGLHHPLSTRLFDGPPELELLRTYLRHQWYRSRGFHRELTEFALGLQLREAVGVYANLHDEVGEGSLDRAHTQLLRSLLIHLDLPCERHDPPPFTEALAYLNNRVRCARSGDRAWGLAVLFSLEYGTPATHGNIHRLLERLAIPEPMRQFHRIHMLGDAEHAEIFIEQILRLVLTPADRSTFLVSLHHHRSLGTRYFDRIWDEIQQARPT